MIMLVGHEHDHDHDDHDGRADDDDGSDIDGQWDKGHPSKFPNMTFSFFTGKMASEMHVAPQIS